MTDNQQDLLNAMACEQNEAHQTGSADHQSLGNSTNSQATEWQLHFTPEGQAYYFNIVTGVSSWERPANFVAGTTQKENAGASVSSVNQMTGNQFSSTKNMMPVQPTTSGPPGCNLFVFHVPNSWKDTDLYTHFAPFGNIISARLQKDPSTNATRGFGFVSYSAPLSASNAIAAMNGFNVDGKWLKVQLKKGEENAMRAAGVNFPIPTVPITAPPRQPRTQNFMFPGSNRQFGAYNAGYCDPSMMHPHQQQYGYQHQFQAQRPVAAQKYGMPGAFQQPGTYSHPAYMTGTQQTKENVNRMGMPNANSLNMGTTMQTKPNSGFN